MAEAGLHWARRYEDVFLSGATLFKDMQKVSPDKRIYLIGTNGNSGEEYAESLGDALGYVPAPDGTLFIDRVPDPDRYTPTRYHNWVQDKQVSEKSKISAVDLFVEDEEKYRDLETEVLKEFDTLDTNGYPALMVVGEGAVLKEENVEIIKKGIVVWLDCDPTYSWVKTQKKALNTGGVFVPKDKSERPPVWAIANGWDGDVDDGEGKKEYRRIVETRREIYEKLADIRLRVDIPGIAENSYWGAERIVKSIRELLGINTSEEGSVDEEVLETDLTKFLEGARLSKYMEPALAWCEEQGAASIEDIVENIGEFGEALSLKPLELKRLTKAAAAASVN